MPCVQLYVDKEEGSFRIQGRSHVDNPSWTLHVVGRIVRAPEGASTEPVSMPALCTIMAKTIDKSAHYRVAQSRGIAYGPACQGLEVIRVGTSEALGEIRAPAAIASQAADYGLPPCLLDACLQTLFGASEESAGAPQSTYLPVQIAKLRRFRSSEEIAFCHV